MSEKPFFRPESEHARANAWLGRILLIRPASFAFLTACALAIALALGAFFLLGEYTRKARVTGFLAPSHGVVRIVAQQAGIVVAVRTREGDAVEGEAVLFVLGDGRGSLSHRDLGAAVGAQLEERRAALGRQREHAAAASAIEAAALERRREGLLREAAQMDAEMAAQGERSRVASRSLERAAQLEAIGFLSAAARDRERENALEQESRLEALRRAALALHRELSAAALDARAAQARAGAQVAGLDVQRAALEQERVEREVQHQGSIVAPAAGTVAAILVEAGQVVAPGTTLATLLPRAGELEAHLFSPSRSIGFVRADQVVLLRYLAYPHQKFGAQRARVVAVSRNPLLPGEVGFTPPDGSREPVYRIKARLESQSIRAYGQPEALQAGMQLEADILLDRRRLIEWIFEPLLSLAGRT
jgi:membrane fusion protein